jgi:FlaA1/EpsC-like NDP-sugar epimerase
MVGLIQQFFKGTFMKVLVTGASGFIGQTFIKAALEKG